MTPKFIKPNGILRLLTLLTFITLLSAALITGAALPRVYAAHGEMAEPATVLRVVNTRDADERPADGLGGFTIEKRGDGANGPLLSGAEFTLYDSDGYILETDGLGRKLANPVMTDTRGAARFANLSPGLYWLVETQAPYGYMQSEKGLWIVTIDTQGNAKSVGMNNGKLIVINGSGDQHIKPTSTPTPTPTPTPALTPTPTPTPNRVLPKTGDPIGDVMERVTRQLQRMENGTETDADTDTDTDTDTEPPQPHGAGGGAILPQYYALSEQNADVIGWIRIDGTKVDYPVMHTPKDPLLYMHAGLDRAYSYSGLPFLDAWNDPRGDAQNLIVYAHNMRNGTMFGTLPKYESRRYWQTHPTVTFDLLSEEREYEVVGAFRSELSAGDADGADGFICYDYIDLSDINRFREYVRAVKEASLYETGITPEWGDQLLTLSTCSYYAGSDTFALVCRRVMPE